MSPVRTTTCAPFRLPRSLSAACPGRARAIASTSMRSSVPWRRTCSPWTGSPLRDDAECCYARNPEVRISRSGAPSSRLAPPAGMPSGVRSNLDPFGEGSLRIGLLTNPRTTRSRRLATGGGNQRRDGAETGGRHVVVDAFAGAGGNKVGLVPYADIPARPDALVEIDPGRPMGRVAAARIALQVLEGAPDIGRRGLPK
jgi:hypothetical protein